MIIYRARMETRHFTFEAFSTESRGDAVREMEAGVQRHCSQLDLDFGDFIKAHDWDEHEIICGACYRDNEKI